MAPVNSGRVLLGALAGGVVWNLWSIAINVGVLRDRYAAAQQAGTFLAQPRYPFFVGIWILTLFVLAYILAWFYASVRATRGAGPGTALQVGLRSPGRVGGRLVVSRIGQNDINPERKGIPLQAPALAAVVVELEHRRGHIVVLRSAADEPIHRSGNARHQRFGGGGMILRADFLELLDAEFLFLRVTRLDEAVGEEQDGVAGMKLHGLQRVTHGVKHAGRHPALEQFAAASR